MLIISYDISNTKLRSQFSKFLSKFGFRLQYSVFQIKHSPTLLNNIVVNIETVYGARFEESDSVIIFHMSKHCKKYAFGYAKNDDKTVLFIN
jgi:CRISPR-associated protein Cas2